MRDVVSARSVPGLVRRGLARLGCLGLVLALGCGGRDEGPACGLSVSADVCKSCGDNSPVVNGFPVNGVNPGTCKNAQGIWQVPNKVEAKKQAKEACEGRTLDVDEQGILTAGPGCRDKDLVGASFLVQRKRKRVRIRIQEAVTLQRGDKLFPGYVFTLEGRETSLCDRSEAARLRDRLGLETSQSFWDRPATNPPAKDEPVARSDRYTAHDVALVFKGEVYTEDGSILSGSQLSSGKGWFNIACARDALARLDLYGIAPHARQPEVPADYYAKRKAALRMFTANYCWSSRDARYTVEGSELGWQRKVGDGQWDPEAMNETGRLEAIWDEHGAVCLVGTRLFPRKVIASFPDELLPPACRPRGACPDEQAVVNAIVEECRTTAGRTIATSCEGKTGLFRSYGNY